MNFCTSCERKIHYLQVAIDVSLRQFETKIRGLLCEYERKFIWQ